MVNKTLKKKAAKKKAPAVTKAPVVNSAKDLLFAGLGVFSVAQKESEKLFGQGTRLFDRLVSEGARVEKESIHFAENKVGELRTDVQKRLDAVGHQVNENWDSLGNIFDERVSGTLERLGIPTSKDLDKLSGYLQDISAKTTNKWKGFEKMVGDTADNLGKLEKEFSKRVKAALENLHVPTMEDLNKLTVDVQKASRESAANLGKLEATFEKRVSGVFGKLEAATTGEIRKLNSGLQDVSRQVSDNWGKLEGVVEARVKAALDGLGLPSKDDIGNLVKELNKLSSKVTDLEKQLKQNAKTVTVKAETSLAPKSPTSMTVAERKKAAEAISKMKPARKPQTAGE